MITRRIAAGLPAYLDRVFTQGQEWTVRAAGFAVIALSIGMLAVSLPVYRAYFANGFESRSDGVMTIAAVLFFAVGLVAWGLFRQHGIFGVFRLFSLFRRERGNAVFLMGDRRAAAERSWPRATWPTLYQDVPADIRRPVIWDGRILGGVHVTWLAWRHLSDDVVSAIGTAAHRKARVFAFTVFAILATLVTYRLFTGGLGAGPAYPEWAEEIGATGPIVSFYVLAALHVVFAGLSGFALAAAAAFLSFIAALSFGFWAGMNGWWSQASAALATPTRDSLLFYKTKADLRRTEYEAYCRQVQQATTRLAPLPLLPVGRATGVLRARGDMESPAKGQVVGFDGESIRQHVLVLGGTGTGKTRLVMRPLFERVMNAAWGEAHRMGAYVTDGKGTLWRDVADLVRGRQDVRIIGVAADHYGVDLMAGMTPLEVATVFKSVSGQVAGKSADDFWSEQASIVLMHAATIASVLHSDEQTVKAWGETRPYSLLGIARIATSEEGYMAAVSRVSEIIDAVEAEQGEGNLSADLVAADESASWFLQTWKPMAHETRSSIIANVSVVLGKLGGSGELAKRFFRGQTDRVTDVDHALAGGILMVAIGETEHGMAGKVVNTWLKSRLFIKARRRLVSSPEACRSTSCALFADEYQMLVTDGPDSDTSFWNVARETGVFLVAATQSIAALEQVLGRDRTANLVNLLRSKIVLKTEELSTLDFIQKLAGQTPRGFEPEEGFYATQGVRDIERPDVAPRAPRAVSIGSALFPVSPGLQTAGLNDVVAADLSNIWTGDQDGGMSKIKAAIDRALDKSQHAVSSNFSWKNKIELDELLMGNGYAFAIIQRAGGDRADMIDLEAA